MFGADDSLLSKRESNLLTDPEPSMFPISRRWKMIFMLMVGIAVVYCLRVNMSVAAEDMQDELFWTDSEKGLMLSSFYMGYAVGQVPAALVAAKRPKLMFGLAIILPSFLTLFIPVVSRASYPAAIILRTLVGFTESATFPAAYSFFQFWVPKDEKALMISVTMAGMYIGEVIGFSISGFLTATDIHFGEHNNVGRWPAVFYLFGTMGLLYGPYWFWAAYDIPEEDPNITAAELQLLREGATAYAGLTFDDPDGVTLERGEVAERVRQRSRSSSRTISNEQSYMYGSLGTHALVVDGVTVRGADDSAIHESLLGNTSALSVSSGPGTSTAAKKEGGESEYFDYEFLRSIPWKAFFTNPAGLTLMFNAWTFGYIGFMMLSEMPAYLVDELDMDLESAGLLSICPYLAMFIAVIVSAKIFEYVQFERKWEVRSVRHVAELVSLVGSAGMLVITSYMDDHATAFVFMILSQALLGAAQSGLGCSFLEASPKYSAILNATANTFSALGGIVGPIFVAEMVTRFGSAGWKFVFWFTFIQGVISFLLFIKYITAAPIPELNQPAKTE